MVIHGYMIYIYIYHLICVYIYIYIYITIYLICNNNVGTRLVGWHPIVAFVFLLIQFHDVWGGASIVASCFSDFLFFLHFF